MPLNRELSRKIYNLPHWATIGATSLGLAVASAPVAAASLKLGVSAPAGNIPASLGGARAPLSLNPNTRNKPNLVVRTEADMGRLAYRAFHDRKPGGMRMTFYPEGATAVWELTETNVPTRYGSQVGGEYIVDIVAPLAPGTSQQAPKPDFNHVYKIEVAEGGVTAAGPDGELNNGTILIAQSTGNNTRIADVTFAFNIPTPSTSEAAAHPLHPEIGETVKMEHDWNNLGGQILTMAEHHMPTGPLNKLWRQPLNVPPRAF